MTEEVKPDRDARAEQRRAEREAIAESSAEVVAHKAAVLEGSEGSERHGRARSAEFTVGRLTAESQAFFGQPSHVLSGALHGRAADESVSVSEAERAVKAFLGR